MNTKNNSKIDTTPHVLRSGSEQSGLGTSDLPKVDPYIQEAMEAFRAELVYSMKRPKGQQYKETVDSKISPKIRTQTIDKNSLVKGIKIGGLGGLVIGVVLGTLGTAYLMQPKRLEKQDDGFSVYSKIGIETKFPETGEKILISEPSDAFRHAVSSDKFRGVYDRTFNPEYKPK